MSWKNFSQISKIFDPGGCEIMIPGPWIHKEGIPERPIIKARISTKAYTKKSYGYLHVHIEIPPFVWKTPCAKSTSIVRICYIHAIFHFCEIFIKILKSFYKKFFVKNISWKIYDHEKLWCDMCSIPIYKNLNKSLHKKELRVPACSHRNNPIYADERHEYKIRNR